MGDLAVGLCGGAWGMGLRMSQSGAGFIGRNRDQHYRCMNLAC